MTEKLLIAANWKMNDAPTGFDAPDSPYRPKPDIDVVVFATHMDIARCVECGIVTGGQGARPEAKGAFTGDVSMSMLRSRGCTHVLCGHSERRKFHEESDAFVAEQAKAALALGLIPIVCVGETLDERTSGKEKDVVRKQLESIPAAVNVIAYEPVWAIGTGKNATPAEAQEMHAFIRSLRPDTRIIYGGSLSAANARDLLSQPDIDGGLIGGASLKVDEFRTIVETGRAL